MGGKSNTANNTKLLNTHTLGRLLMELKNYLLKLTTYATDDILGYISKRLCVDENPVQLTRVDYKHIRDLDALESNRSHYTEQCYEYFLGRLDYGIEYFINKIYKQEPDLEHLEARYFHYMYNYFLKYLVIDFNRKLQVIRKNDHKKHLQYRAFLQAFDCFKGFEIEILEDYLATELSQKEIAIKHDVSASRVNRLLKKLDKLQEGVL